MAKKKSLTKLSCSVCKNINYYTKKSKKFFDKKIELKKFCRECRKHTLHKEIKK